MAQKTDGAIEHRPAPGLIARAIEKLRQRADRRDVARRLVDRAPQLDAGPPQIAVHQDLAQANAHLLAPGRVRLTRHQPLGDRKRAPPVTVGDRQV